MIIKIKHTIFNWLWLVSLTAMVSCSPWNPPENEENVASEVFKTFLQQMSRQYTCFSEHPVNWDSVYVTNIIKLDSLQSDEELIDLMSGIVNDLEDAQLKINVPDHPILKYIPPAVSYDYPGSFAFPSSSDYSIDYPPSGSGAIISHRQEDKMYRFAYVGMASYSLQPAERCHLVLDELNQLNPDGFIVELRNSDQIDMEVMINFVRQFYEGERKLLQVYKRESAEDRTKMVFFKDIIVTGEGTVPNDKTVVLLVNSLTIGTANVCAHLMKQYPNVMVVGTLPTSGGGAESSWVSLTHEWALKFSHDVKYFINGVSCEQPLQPDILVNNSIMVDDTLVGTTHERLRISASMVMAMNLIEAKH